MMLLEGDDGRKLLFLHCADVLIYDDFSSPAILNVRALGYEYCKTMISFLSFHFQPGLITVHSTDIWWEKLVGIET